MKLPDYSESEVLRLIMHCATEAASWQIENNLNDAYTSIPADGRPYVVSGRFNFILQLKRVLANNTNLFYSENTFRIVETWINDKIRAAKFAATNIIPLQFPKPAIENHEQVAAAAPSAALGQTEEDRNRQEFYNLFYDERDIEICFSVLKGGDIPVISDDNKFCLGKRKKFVITAWLRALSARGYLKYLPTPKQIQPLINVVIHSLSIKEDTLRRTSAKQYTHQYEEFKKALPERIQR